MPSAHCLLSAAFCLLLAAYCPLVAAEPWHEDFEGPKTTWTRAGGDVHVAAWRQERITREAYAGRQCEWLQVAGQGGTTVYVGHSVQRASVINELTASLWVKADRPGIQILARAVLPRTVDPRSRTPVMVLLEGTSYAQVGRWQQLRIENLPELLGRRIRGLRLQIGPHVDGREAYVDQILLNVYGGPGTTNVWIDELSLAGYAHSTSTAGPAVVPLEMLPDSRRPAGSSLANPSTSLGGNAPGTQSAVIPTGAMADAGGRLGESPVLPDNAPSGLPADRTAGRARAELVGFELRVDGEPLLLRAVTYHGESLAKLKELGLNAVWLSQPASPTLLAEAEQLGLFVVCPPPQSVVAPPSSDPAAPLPQIGPEYRPVVAWDLGGGLTEAQLTAVRALAPRLRAADGHCRRPLVCRPESNLWDYSGLVDVVAVGQSPLATSLELSDYGRWIGYRSRLARLDTAIWSTVQIEPAAALWQQWAAGGQQASLPPEIAVEQIRLMAYTAIAAGSRGLWFESSRSLEAADPATQARAAAIELVNLELELARPWAAAGELVGTISGGQPETSAAVFKYHRTRLLVPLWSGPGAQYVPGQSAARELTFVVPDVPESSRAYELTPGGLRPIRPIRVTRGVQVTLGEFSLCSMVLFAEDPTIVDNMRRQAQTIGPRAARLYRQLAARKLEIVEDVGRRMARYAPAQWQGGENVVEARKYLQSCDGALAAKSFTAACLEAEHAMQVLRMVERSNWQKAVAAIRSPIVSPATVCFSTLPWHWSLGEQTRSWRLGSNLAAGGDFESFPAVTSAGWTCYQHATPQLVATSEIAAKAAHSGRAGLRLAVRPAVADQTPTLVETSPIWVTSPTVYVEAGSLVRILGWVHVPTPLTGSVDGLLVFDSITGEAMAERIGETTGWQPFALYRVAPQSGPMSVTLAMCGLGEVWIDDLMIQTLAPGPTPLGQSPVVPARRF